MESSGAHLSRLVFSSAATRKAFSGDWAVGKVLLGVTMTP
jgi:hypothetical protein